MTTDRWMRASDQDRESAAEMLREAYAVGRLSREEFDERTDAAYSARTWGELRDLTSDIPLLAAGASLPSDTVASRGMPRRGSRRSGQTIWTFMVVLAAALTGLVSPAVARVAAVLVPLALLLPFVLPGASLALRHPRRTRSARPGSKPPAPGGLG